MTDDASDGSPEVSDAASGGSPDATAGAPTDHPGRPPAGRDGPILAAVSLVATPGGTLQLAVVDDTAELDPCDLLLAAPPGAAVAAIAQVPVDPTPAAVITVDDRGGGGSWCGPLPPLDVAAIPSMRHLPRIEGATVLVQLLLTRSPVGAIPYWMDVRDGQLVGMAAGTVAGPDVLIGFRYENYLRMRTGELYPADAIADGNLAGDYPKLQVFSGIVQSPPYLEAYRDGFTAFGPLLAYTHLTASDAYRGFTAALRRALDLAGPAGAADEEAPR